MGMSDRASARAARARLAQAEGGSEAQFQATITDLLDLLGYRWHHETDSRRTHGGWPDLFAVQPATGWAFWLEVKSSNGKPTEEQISWLGALGWSSSRPLELDHAARRGVGLIRPRDWPELEAALRAGCRRG